MKYIGAQEWGHVYTFVALVREEGVEEGHEILTNFDDGLGWFKGV